MVSPGPPDESPMLRERERARRVATNIVAIALGIAGATFFVLAIALALKGGGGVILLAVILGLMGIALALAGFFFQLVPLRVEELAEEKRAYDRRMREQR